MSSQAPLRDCPAIGENRGAAGSSWCPAASASASAGSGQVEKTACDAFSYVFDAFGKGEEQCGRAAAMAATPCEADQWPPFHFEPARVWERTVYGEWRCREAADADEAAAGRTTGR